MLKNYLLTITFAFLATCLQAQGVVKGNITTNDGGSEESLPGASVLVKGTTQGTITDANGNFSLSDVAGDDILLVSFIGYVTQEVPVNNQSSLQVRLVADVTSLDEVVVVGYGTQKRGDLTSAISSVDGEAFKGRPVQSTQELLQGQVSGLTITNDGGEPGAGGKVRIRGVGTFGNNDPLYVVDGIPVNNGLNFLNPNDIASIEVFKDAAAAAIYGNRAANGVIYVTTKKGQAGKTSVTFDASYGLARNGRLQELSGANEYMDYLRLKNLDPAVNDLYAQGYNTNWTDAIMRTGSNQNYNLGISGGTDKSHYFTSVAYSKVEGTHLKSDNTRFTARLNSDYELSKWFKFSENLTVAYEKRHSINRLGLARETPPIVPIYKTDQQIADLAPADRALNQYYDVAEGIGFGQNQRAAIERFNGERNWLSLIGNVQGEVNFGNVLKPLEGLKFTSTLGFERFNEDGSNFDPLYSLGTRDFSVKTHVHSDYAKYFHWTWNNFLSYDKTFGRHDVGLTAGVVGEEETRNWVSADGSFGLSNNQYLQVIDAMTGERTNGGNAYRHAYSSAVGRVTYSYDSRYLFQASIRRDGSYRFAPGKRWGTFPSIGLGWRISNEPFFQNLNLPAISNLKLRGSWGQLGNDRIPSEFEYLSTIVGGYERGYVLGGVGGSNDSKRFVQGYAPNKAINPDLTWETTTSTNLGLELGMFGDKLSFEFEYYTRYTKDVLFQKQLPFYSGFPGVDGIAPITQWVNGAEIDNRGFDLSLGYNNNFGDLGVSLGLNLGRYKAKIVSIDDDNPITVSDARIPTVIRMEAGDPLGAFYGYVVEGFYDNEQELLNGEDMERQQGAQVGDFRFADINGDSIIDGTDRQVIGNPNPKLTYSFNLNFDYKGFDLKTFWYGTYGNDIYKIGEIYFNGWDEANAPQNIWSGVVANSWTEQNMNAQFPKVSPGSSKRNYEKGPTSYGIKDGSFLRLKNVQLGYTFPQSLLGNIGIESLRLYVSAENLFVLTKYDGGDPEIGSGVTLNPAEGGRSGSPSYALGLDYADRYPIQKTYAVGLSVRF